MNKGTSKTWGAGASQDNIGKNDKKGSEEKGVSQNNDAPLAAEASTKIFGTSVRQNDGRAERRPFEIDPLTGRSLHRLVDFEIMKKQEKLEEELALEQQILRDKKFEKKKQRILLMAELLEQTNVPSAKQVSVAWKPGKCQEKNQSNKGYDATFDEEKGRRAQERCWTRRGQQIRVGSAGGNEDKTNELEGGDG